MCLAIVVLVDVLDVVVVVVFHAVFDDVAIVYLLPLCCCSYLNLTFLNASRL